MQTGATNTDRARIVRSLLSLAVVGTLLVAMLVPLPGLYSRQKSASSPTIALRDWERRDRERFRVELARRLASQNHPCNRSLVFEPEDEPTPTREPEWEPVKTARPVKTDVTMSFDDG